MMNRVIISQFYLKDVKTLSTELRGYGISNIENTIRFFGDKMPIDVKIALTNELAHRGVSGYCSKYTQNQY